MDPASGALHGGYGAYRSIGGAEVDGAEVSSPAGGVVWAQIASIIPRGHRDPPHVHPLLRARHPLSEHQVRCV